MNIDCLIPYFRENLITFPLAEEFDYRPTLNFDFELETLPKDFTKEKFIASIKKDNSEFWKANKHIRIELVVKKRAASEDEFCGFKIKLKEKHQFYFSIFNKRDLLTKNSKPTQSSKMKINEQIDILVEAAKNIINYYEKIR